MSLAGFKLSTKRLVYKVYLFFAINYGNLSLFRKLNKLKYFNQAQFYSYYYPLKKLIEHLTGSNYFEWGPGWNTELAKRKMANVFSVEHELEWYGKYKNINQLIYSPIANNSCLQYPLEINKIKDRIDLAFIDGRCRTECVNSCKQKGVAVVVVHDSLDTNYNYAFEGSPYPFDTETYKSFFCYKFFIEFPVVRTVVLFDREIDYIKMLDIFSSWPKSHGLSKDYINCNQVYQHDNIFKLVKKFCRSLYFRISNFFKKIFFIFINSINSLVFKESLYIDYQKKHLLVSDCRDSDNSLKEVYLKGDLVLLNKNLQTYCDDLFELIKSRIAAKNPYSLIRLADGELYFLQGRLFGNIKSRHYTNTEKPRPSYLKSFGDRVIDNDDILIEMKKSLRRGYLHYFHKEIQSEFPMESLYALIATRQIFKLPYKIGLIGSKNKLTLIENLLSYKQYQAYLGLSGFYSYIKIPELGACNDVEATLNSIMSQMDLDVDVYFVGIGIAKLYVLSELKKRTGKIFIDIGCGISALAGLTSNDRPYFADWINFRLKTFDYNSLDIMDASLAEGKNVVMLSQSN